MWSLEGDIVLLLSVCCGSFTAGTLRQHMNVLSLHCALVGSWTWTLYIIPHFMGKRGVSRYCDPQWAAARLHHAGLYRVDSNFPTLIDSCCSWEENRRKPRSVLDHAITGIICCPVQTDYLFIYLFLKHSNNPFQLIVTIIVFSSVACSLDI